MKHKYYRRSFVSVFIGVIFGTLSFQSSAEVRTWTSIDGRTLEAEFVKGDDKSVTIKRGPQGFNLLLDNISEEDREYVRQKIEEMKRVDLSAIGEYAKYAKGEWVKGDIDGLLFQIYAPTDYEREERVPLVVFLHGVGERGEDNEQQVNGLPKVFATSENQAKRKCIVVAPQCPSDKYWNNRDVTEQVIEMVEVLAEHMPVDEKSLSVGLLDGWYRNLGRPRSGALTVCRGDSHRRSGRFRDCAVD